MTVTALIHPFDPDLALLVGGAIVGGVVQGISGFAFGMTAMSIWTWGIDPGEATVMAVFGGLCGQVLAAFAVKQRTALPELAPFLIGGLLGVPLGAYVLPYVGATQFKLLLGSLLAMGCPLMLAAPRIQFVNSMGRAGAGLAGVAGGVIGGLSGLTGIAPGIWCALRGYDKARQRALLQDFNLAILAATMVALTWRGTVTTAMIPHLAIVSGALLIPLMLGVKVYRRLSDNAFRRTLLLLLTLSGLVLMASALGTNA